MINENPVTGSHHQYIYFKGYNFCLWIRMSNTGYTELQRSSFIPAIHALDFPVLESLRSAINPQSPAQYSSFTGRDKNNCVDSVTQRKQKCKQFPYTCNFIVSLYAAKTFERIGWFSRRSVRYCDKRSLLLTWPTQKGRHQNNFQYYVSQYTHFPDCLYSGTVAWIQSNSSPRNVSRKHIVTR
jgi:hypothetical protein